MKFSNQEDFEDEADFDQDGEHVNDDEVAAKRKKIEEAV